MLPPLRTFPDTCSDYLFYQTWCPDKSAHFRPTIINQVEGLKKIETAEGMASVYNDSANNEVKVRTHNGGWIKDVYLPDYNQISNYGKFQLKVDSSFSVTVHYNNGQTTEIGINGRLELVFVDGKWHNGDQCVSSSTIASYDQCVNLGLCYELENEDIADTGRIILVPTSDRLALHNTVAQGGALDVVTNLNFSTQLKESYQRSSYIKYIDVEKNEELTWYGNIGYEHDLKIEYGSEFGLTSTQIRCTDNNGRCSPLFSNGITNAIVLEMRFNPRDGYIKEYAEGQWWRNRYSISYCGSYTIIGQLSQNAIASSSTPSTDNVANTVFFWIGIIAVTCVTVGLSILLFCCYVKRSPKKIELPPTPPPKPRPKPPTPKPKLLSPPATKVNYD